jgi:hypothetical protein
MSKGGKAVDISDLAAMYDFIVPAGTEHLVGSGTGVTAVPKNTRMPRTTAPLGLLLATPNQHAHVADRLEWRKIPASWYPIQPHGFYLQHRPSFDDHPRVEAILATSIANKLGELMISPVDSSTARPKGVELVASGPAKVGQLLCKRLSAEAARGVSHRKPSSPSQPKAQLKL